MTSSDSLTVRAFREEDFPAYVALLNAASEYEGKAERTTEAEQREYAALYTINLDKDRMVIEHPTAPTLIAVCDVWQIHNTPSAASTLLVHPEWRRRGLGSRLLHAGIQHAVSLNATALDAFALPEQGEIRSFLERHNFAVAGFYRDMTLAADKPLPKPNLGSYTVRTFDQLEGSEGDKIDLVLKAANQAWGDLWGHQTLYGTEGRKTIQDNMLPHHESEAMFFLFDGENYVGHDRISFSEGEDGAKVGHAGVPGLLPAYRSPELYRELALIGLNWLYEQGCAEIKLSSWGDSEGTIRAFEDLGFTMNFYELGYQRVLSGV